MAVRIVILCGNRRCLFMRCTQLWLGWRSLSLPWWTIGIISHGRARDAGGELMCVENSLQCGHSFSELEVLCLDHGYLEASNGRKRPVYIKRRPKNKKVVRL